MSQYTTEDKLYASPTPSKVSCITTEQNQDEKIDLGVITLSNTISQAVSNLEKRLDTCEGVYKLAMNTNAVREKEREIQLQVTQKLLDSFESRLSKVEETLDKIPDTVKETINNEYAKNEFNDKMQKMLEAFITEMNDQMDALEQSISINIKNKQKNIKSVRRNLTLIQTAPKDDSTLIELEDQIANLKRSQQTMTDIFSSLQTDTTHVEE